MVKIIEVSELHYLVQSSENKRDFYTVDLRLRECNCPDAVYRGIPCKHVRAVEAKAKIYG
jgi:uncharacterized Zn finger protein